MSHAVKIVISTFFAGSFIRNNNVFDFNPVFLKVYASLCLKRPFYPQHLFPDADQDLEGLEIEQQQLLFNKMENSKNANLEQGPQVILWF